MGRSWARKGFDLLMAHYPDADLAWLDSQPERTSGAIHYQRAAGLWWSVDLSVGSFAIWKETGAVYRVDDFGAAAADPFLVPEGSSYDGPVEPLSA